MSTQFRPLEIPPGVVAKATKQQRSTNWAEVNLMRWVEGQMAPVGGQSQFNFTFASRCKKIHSWYDHNQINRTAFLCEQHLYILTAGTLVNVSPTPPLVSPTPVGAGGYGDGIYSSADPYGTPPHIETIQALDKVPSWYSLDNFGTILYAMTSADGRLLKWDPAVGGAAIVQPADSGRGPVPTGRGFVVTNERFVMIFGTGSDGTVDGGKPNRFAWCDQENPGAWDYASVTSQAGFLDIEPASPIITASSTRNGIILFTAKKAYNSQFLGMPYIYNYVELGSNCTPWSPQSISATSSMIVWMSKQGMWAFDGTSIVPMNCLIRPWIDDDIDDLQVREQACMVHVGDFNEVWWFFPQQGQTKNSRCAIYSYKEGWWSQGRMGRTAGITSSYTSHTIMADDRIAYQHEVPYAYPASVPLPWAETYDLNLNSGSKLTMVKQLQPDIDGAVANVLYSLLYRISRSLVFDYNGNIVPTPEAQTALKQVRSNGYVDFRITARDIRLRIEIGAPAGQPRPPVYPVTVGQHLIDSVPRGDR